MRIVCIHAHPDDAEFLAGGTLALLAQAGHKVIILTMTSGDCGSTTLPPEEIADLRRLEAQRAAAVIGAEHHTLGFKDLSIFEDDASRRRVTAALRRHRPDLVLTASPRDYHCDHEATSRLVTDACFGASAPNYHTQAFDQAPALPAIPHLYYVDPAEGIDREGNTVPADFFIDVGSVMELKRKMLAAHSSQREWLKRQHGMDDYLETMEEWTRSRGRLCGVEWAEGFRQYKGHAYPRTPALQELLAAYLRPPLA
ncbi:MAG: PIG-L family deacetylase [Bryobacteraceae bacterium]